MKFEKRLENAMRMDDLNQAKQLIESEFCKAKDHYRREVRRPINNVYLYQPRGQTIT